MLIAFFKRLLLFAFIPAIPVLLLSRYDNLDGKSSPEMNIIKLSAMRSFDSLDMLFVGSSYCYSAVKNSYFDSIGYKTFNLGLGAAGPYFYDLVINDYISSVKKKPATIFINVAPNTFSSVCDNFSAYPIHRYLAAPVSNETVSIKYNYWGKYLDMESKSIEKAVLNLLKRGNKKINTKQLGEIQKNKGFYESYEVYDSLITGPDIAVYKAMYSEKFDLKKFNHLKKLATSLENSGIKVVFFDVPTNKLKTFFSPEFLAQYDSNMNNLSKEFTFISNDLHFNYRLYRGVDHINTPGAIVFTNDLAQKIFNTPSLLSVLQKSK